MKISAVAAIFLAGMICASLAHAQQPKAATPSVATPAPNSAAGKAAAAETQREADETLARTYMATKHYAEAIATYDRLAKSNPRNPSYLNLAGIARMQNGDMRGARTSFQRSIKVESRFADAYNNLGATWYSEKNFKRALQFYQRAVALQPGIAGYHTNVGYAYFNLKMPVEAEQSFRRALLMDPFIFQQNDRSGSVLQDRSVQDKGLFAFTMAKSYANTGDAAHCAGYLRRAIDEGYKDIALVYTDVSFAGVLADPDVQAALSLIPASQNQAAAPVSR